MIEKIGKEGYESISKPCYQVLDLIKQNKKCNEAYHVAEIGVGIGATSIEVMKLLKKEDHYYMFSFDSEVLELEDDLKKTENECSNIHAIGNTRKTYDSYSWSLVKLLNSLKEKEIFDLVYLDGAHSFFHDGLACCLLKKMTKQGGVHSV